MLEQTSVLILLFSFSFQFKFPPLALQISLMPLTLEAHQSRMEPMFTGHLSHDKHDKCLHVCVHLHL